MFNTGRRSHISTSEFGLYSDHSDLYNRNTYGASVRKIAVVIMVVVSVILIGIFLYDFASSASISSKVSQETKHIYILQNNLRKQQQQQQLNAANRRSSVVTVAPTTVYVVSNNSQTTIPILEDRSDDEARITGYRDDVEPSPTTVETRVQRMSEIEQPESRNQNLKNFKLRNIMLNRRQQELEDPTRLEKQIMDNHAVIYRMGNRLKFPEPDDSSEDAPIGSDDGERATPFRFELKGPHPASFKRQKYPQLSQYRYPHASRNIQDIIKYLTNDPETLNRGIKFTGFYVNPKKYDTSHMEIGEVALNSDRSEEHEAPPFAISFNGDPLYQYKPKHPADVNLLATSNFRFSPTGMQRYNPYYESYYHQRPGSSKHSVYQESQYDGITGSYPSSPGKKRKPKPFSVMLDIYPITEAADQQTKKSSLLKPASSSSMIDDVNGDPRRLLPLSPYYSRYPKVYGMQSQSPVGPLVLRHHPHQQAPEEEEKHQMILHLNLYPKRKNKLTRDDAAERSQTIAGETSEPATTDRLAFPLDAIAKHLAAYAAAAEEDNNANNKYLETSQSAGIRYEEAVLAKEETAAQTEKLIGTTIATTATAARNNCDRDCEDDATASTIASPTETTTTATVERRTEATNESSTVRDIDTVEGFQQFADSLIAID